MCAKPTVAKMSAEGIHSALLGSVAVYGDDFKPFSRKITHGSGTKAAGESATNARELMPMFAKTGAVTIKAKAAIPSEQGSAGDNSALWRFRASDSPKVR